MKHAILKCLVKHFFTYHDCFLFHSRFFFVPILTELDDCIIIFILFYCIIKNLIFNSDVNCDLVFFLLLYTLCVMFHTLSLIHLTNIFRLTDFDHPFIQFSYHKRLLSKSILLTFNVNMKLSYLSSGLRRIENKENCTWKYDVIVTIGNFISN